MEDRGRRRVAILDPQSSLLSQQLHDDFTLARAVVEINQHDLLPGAEQQSAILERHRQRATLQSGAHV